VHGYLIKKWGDFWVFFRELPGGQFSTVRHHKIIQPVTDADADALHILMRTYVAPDGLVRLSFIHINDIAQHMQ